MKYELETIPIWDSYNENSECPVCLLKKKAEKNYHGFFLGNSVMVPEMRIKVNAAGFCPEHYTRLLVSRDNRHGLGLITHTHFVEKKKEFNKKTKSFLSESKKKNSDKFLHDLSAHLRKETSKCMICDRIDYTLKRYVFTIVYLWKKDPEFKKKFEESKGFCMPHLADILDMAGEVHSAKLTVEFAEKAISLCSESFEKLDKEVFWYTQKFDFQNNDKPWGTSKDALHRTIQKLTGIFQKDE